MSDIQRDREERQHVIEVLKSWDGYFIGYTSDEVQEALRYAIASIKTDLKYDLLYEETSGQADKPTTKNDLGVDCISRNTVLTLINDVKNANGFSKYTQYEYLFDQVDTMPPVTLIRPKGHWINKHRFVESWSCSAECSSCHKRSNGYIHDNGYGLESTYYDFCPKCGSDNREVE